jgi:hypothetical protein
MGEVGEISAESIWITLNDRQKELLFWQVVRDLGGEISTIPADDVPGRRLLFHNDGAYWIGMCATEGFDDAQARHGAGGEGV